VAKTQLYGWAFFGALATITYLSLSKLPFLTPDLGFDFADKLGHALAYATTMILGSLFWKARTALVQLSFLNMVYMGLLLLGYGMIIEVLQHVLPVNRWAEIWDVVANGIGILTGGLIFHFLFNRTSVKKA